MASKAKAVGGGSTVVLPFHAPVQQPAGNTVGVSIFGLGYVGAVSAGCLAASGHAVVGVDLSPAKVGLVNRGESPIFEDSLQRLISDAFEAKRISATQDPAAAIAATDLSLICVGTPSKPNGDLDLAHIVNVTREIGAAIAKKNAWHAVVIRSTVLPGTIRNVVIPLLEEISGKKAGVDFGVGINPEFLREGTAVDDFFNPPKVVIAATDTRTEDQVAGLYRGIKGPIVRTSIEVAEMVKYSDNAWHALKIAFANEIGTMAKALAIDSHEVMDIFCSDRKLNLSALYMRPGFAFGGSCLPKDVRALLHRAKSLDLELPVIGGILPSNARKVTQALDMIVGRGRRRVSILGMSFKVGTDDLRESPLLELIERLIGKGFDVRVFDHNVNMARLVGANREFLLKAIPHISALLVESLDEALAHGNTIVVGHAIPEFMNIASRLRPDQNLIDLVRIDGADRLGERYEGISW